MDIQISTRKSGNATILDVRGRITSGPTGDSFRAELLKLAENAPLDLLVNLAEVTQMDSSGIGALVQSYVSLTRRGGRLRILNPTGKVREVLEVTRLTTSLPTYTDEAKALASFRPGPRDA
jgi:anti-sigma B factor antagonist